MDGIEFAQRCTGANRKVQALLQQLIAHRGNPSIVTRLTPHAEECLNEVFALRSLADQHNHPAGMLNESARMLKQHFPALLEDQENWEEF